MYKIFKYDVFMFMDKTEEYLVRQTQHRDKMHCIIKCDSEILPWTKL